TYAPSAADITAGSRTLTLTAVANTGCTDVISTKTITITTAPTAVAGTAITTCNSSPAVNITAGSSATNNASITWTSNGTGTFTNATSLTTCTYLPSAADNAAGSRTLTLTAIGNGTCGNITSTKTITIVPTPTITSTTPGSTSGPGTVTLGATASAGTISWYAASIGGAALGTGTSFITPVIAVSTTYYVDTDNGSCTSSPRTAVLATVLLPEINVVGNGASIPDDIVPAPAVANFTDFSTVTTTRTFTIQNTGTANLTLGAITFTGANNTEFTVLTAPISPVAPGGSTTFVVRFTPTAATVNRTATISIVNNDSNEGPYDFRLFGTGVAQEINVQGFGATNIADGDVTPTVAKGTDFGSVDVNSGTATTTFTIQNTGTMDLTGGVITFTGGTPGDFSVTTLPTFPVAGVTSTTFVVTFNPSASGLISTTLNIANNDAGENPYNFTIQGTGVQPEIALSGNAVPIPDNSLSVPTAADWTDFGPTNVVIGNITRTFTISNSPGTSALTIGAITISGANASDFTVTAFPSASVAIGGSTTFVITFVPSANGTRSASISIANNDGNENPYDFNIQGTGTSQEIDIQGNATSIADNPATAPSVANWTDFSTVATTRTFTIFNTGSSQLTLGAITFSGANASDFAVTTAPPASVNPGASTTFTVTFTPTGLGVRAALISIASNDVDENPYDFRIQGNGSDREINVVGNGVSIVDGGGLLTTADWTDFSTVATTRNFTIQNTGSTPLNIGAITFSGADASMFTVITAPSATIAGYGSTTLGIRFTPTSVGVKNASVSIVNDDSNENPYDFNLKGTGVAQEIAMLGSNAVNIVDNGAAAAGNLTDFSNVAVTRTFTIQNLGTMDLTIGAITATGNTADFTITTPPSTIIAGMTSTTFVVTFAPTVTGNRAVTFTFVNNDSNGDEAPFDLKLAATSASEIDISGTAVSIVDGTMTPSTTNQTNFGTVSIENGSVIVIYTIKNTGTGPLVMGAITIDGANATDFTVSTAPAASVAAGGSTLCYVTFKPFVLGTKNAVIHFANNDINENPYDFAIMGTAIRTYVDTDGDGITDNFDLDDDNDGIVDTLEQSTCSASPYASTFQHIFLNETFGYGTTRGQINVNTPDATSNMCYEDGVSTGKVNTGGCPYRTDYSINDGEYAVNYMISTGNATAGPPNVASWANTNWTPQMDHTPGDTDGRMAIFNADINPGIFYELTINGIIPNLPINFDFWVLNIMSKALYAGSNLPQIKVDFKNLSGAVIATYSTPTINRCTDNTNNCAVSEWKNFPTTVNLGNITAFTVTLSNLGPGGSGNDLAIDDIVISQSYCDWDSDGIGNLYDLDSDNDGIPDIEEGGFKQYSNGLSKMDITNPALWADANGNGMNDAIDPLFTGLNNSIPDTDGDGQSNYLDLDSDNDALFDVDEAIANMGDGDINGDGKGDGVDTDLDGILDIYDTYAGFGTLTKPYTQNTDGLGNPDYLQVDSNNDGIKDIAETLYSALDANNDGVIDGAADIDKDGISDAFDTKTTGLGSPRDLNRKLQLEFDGRNDYGQGTGVLGGLANASLMAWVDLNSAFSTDGIVVGQTNFQLRITSAKRLEAVVNGTTVTYATALSVSQWTHVGVVYDGSNIYLYLNGALVATQSKSGNIAADASLLTIGKDPTTNTKYFKGKIDEVRVFNVALTASQLQRMVYQEIQNTATQVRGAIVPKDVGGLPFANVLRYYRMDAYKDDIIDDLTTVAIDVAGMKIYNNKNIYVQQAPMPFLTERTGSFATAVNSPTKEIRGLDIMDQDWSIVQVSHNITESSNNVDLGMFVDSGINIIMNNDNKIQNDWYLKLDGKIDLQGKSQLVQTTNSDLEVTSAGSIERDQQGQSNKFNYNYWSSPVGALSITSNNNPFTVDGVMKDGTDPANIQNITWTNGLNGAATSPITLSTYWIFKFQNVSAIYANWARIAQTGSLLAGQGFTLKGSDAATATQNYTFVGKPNSGTISTPIAANNSNLSGNPYPSALDANAFINANLASTSGTLYFWEHFSTNPSHVLAAYQGGYATRNLVGGVAPVSPAGISGLGSSLRQPGRYIPVGQGFFVDGSATGGNIVFDNSQRAFFKEDNAASNIMFRQNLNGSPLATTPFNNSDDIIPIESAFASVRLGFNSANNFHRQILLGFMNERATSGIDPGYDAIQNDNQPNDMYFMNHGKQLVIQGDGYFNPSNIYPLGVKTALDGNVKFNVDARDRFDISQKLYIYDNTTSLYHDISNEAFEIYLPVGTVNDRFSLRFKNAALDVNNFDLNDNVKVAFTNSDNMIIVKNNLLDTTVKSVTLFNMLGQSLSTWKIKDEDQTKIQIPVYNLSTGTYIVKVFTTKGEISKKIIIK
ncbi:choice-of-anchor D domain-containing protein, partial [Flavobacterium psychrotolerans]